MATVATAVLLIAGPGCSGDDGPGDADGNAQPAAGGTAPRSNGESDSDTGLDAGVSGCGSGNQPEPGTELLSLAGGEVSGTRSDDPEREVQRVIPESYDGVEPAPLLLSLHGFTSNIEQIDLFSDLPTRAAERGYVLLTPQALPATVPFRDETIDAPFWNVMPEQSGAIEGAQDDLAYLRGLVDDTMAQLCIDADRVYVTGNSNGAGMAAALACDGDDRFAAIAPVSGINLAGRCDEPSAVSVIAFHGDADPLVAYDGGSAATLALDIPAVSDQVASFAGADGCDREPGVSEPFEDIRLSAWTDCGEGLAVELYTVIAGGHTWPGMLNYVEMAKLSALGENQELARLAGLDLGEIAGHMTTSIEATQLMLDFFDGHQRAG